MWNPIVWPYTCIRSSGEEGWISWFWLLSLKGNNSIESLMLDFCSCPPERILRRFLEIVEETPGALAVHCKVLSLESSSLHCKGTFMPINWYWSILRPKFSSIKGMILLKHLLWLYARESVFRSTSLSTNLISMRAQAGLGRTGVLIGCYIMKHCRFTCNEVSSYPSLTTFIPSLLLLQITSRYPWNISPYISFRLCQSGCFFFERLGLVETGSVDYPACHSQWTVPHFCLSFGDPQTLGYLRIVRPGSVIGPQQRYLKDMQPRMWKAVRILPSSYPPWSTGGVTCPPVICMLSKVLHKCS